MKEFREILLIIGITLIQWFIIVAVATFMGSRGIISTDTFFLPVMIYSLLFAGFLTAALEGKI